MTARLDLRVQPGAGQTRFAGWYGDVAKLAVAAPAVDGAANAAAIVALADMFGVRRRQVRLVSGANSRNKRFEIDGLTAGELRRRLSELDASGA